VTTTHPVPLLKFYALKRLLLRRFFSGRLPLYLVAEYPKSGGTWYAQMLANYLDIPFPRNVTRPAFCRSVLLGHFLSHPAYRNVTVVVRDGRDIMVSAYYHFLFPNEWNQPRAVARHRAELGFRDYDDIRTNLPGFIEYMCVNWAEKWSHFTITEFVDSWDRSVGIANFIRYEDLLKDAAGQMRRALRNLGIGDIDEHRLTTSVENCRFEKMTGRKRGDENIKSFARKGIAGDWRNHFSADACRVFHRYWGAELLRLGYEADDGWVGQTR